MKKYFMGALIILLLIVPTMAVSAENVYSQNGYDGNSGDYVCEHDWGDWTTTVSATIKKAGTQTRECLYCGEVQTRTTNKLKPFAKFTKKTVTVKAGSTYKLKLKYAKGDFVKKYKSSNKKIATVSKSGKIKAKSKKKSSVAAENGTVYWISGGSVYHSTKNCPTLSRSRNIQSGSMSSCPKSRPCKVCH